MRVSFLIFTYSGDELLTPLCVDFIKETVPEAKIYVVDDGFSSMNYPVRKRLEEAGVIYSQSSWNRYGNLLGPDHLIGATKFMAHMAKSCDIIVKIDPDACLIRRDWIDRLYEDPIALMTSSYKGRSCYPMGNSYAVKASVCKELAKDAELYPGWVNCFEDYEIGVRIARQAKGDTSYSIRYESGIKGGFILTNPWDMDYQKVLNQVRVYCSGYSYGNLPPEKKLEYKNKQVEVAINLLGYYRAAKKRENEDFVLDLPKKPEPMEVPEVVNVPPSAELAMKEIKGVLPEFSGSVA